MGPGCVAGRRLPCFCIALLNRKGRPFLGLAPGSFGTPCRVAVARSFACALSLSVPMLGGLVMYRKGCFCVHLSWKVSRTYRSGNVGVTIGLMGCGSLFLTIVHGCLHWTLLGPKARCGVLSFQEGKHCPHERKAYGGPEFVGSHFSLLLCTPTGSSLHQSLQEFGTLGTQAAPCAQGHGAKCPAGSLAVDGVLRPLSLLLSRKETAPSLS